jgi:hypothetical protein
MEVVRPGSSLRVLTRAVLSSAIGAFERIPPEVVARREFAREDDVAWLARAPTVPASIENTPSLVRMVMPDFLAALSATSVAAKIFRAGLSLGFGNAASIAVPTLEGDASYARFVRAGDPIPVVQALVNPLAVLEPRKLAAIVVLTREMVSSSNAEAIVLDALVRSVGLALDSALLDDVVGDDSRPAGIRNGIAPLTASLAPDPIAALMSDIEMLHRAVAPVSANHPILVMSTTRALMAELRSQHGLAPLVVYGSLALRGTMIAIAIATDAIASVLDGAPEIVSSRDAALQMDANPSANFDAAAVRSIWQTDCVALLVRLPVSWVVRSPRAVAWMTTTNW